MDNKLLLFQKYPVEFVEHFFKDDLWASQRAILESVRDNRATTVRSSHGIGKSFIAARTALWFLYTHPNSCLLYTSPSPRD